MNHEDGRKLLKPNAVPTVFNILNLKRKDATQCPSSAIPMKRIRIDSIPAEVHQVNSSVEQLEPIVSSLPSCSHNSPLATTSTSMQSLSQI